MRHQGQVKHSNGPIVALLLIMYVIVAMGDNFKGIFAPYFKQEFHVEDTQIGLVMTASLFAYAVFQYIGGNLIGRYGYKKVTVLGFITAIVAAVVLALCVNFPMLVFGMFLLNVGMAMFNISVNTLGPALSVGSTALLMSMINFSYGAGTTVLQRVSGALLQNGVPWTNFFFFLAAATAVLLVYLLAVRIPYTPPVSAGPSDKHKVFGNRMLYLYVVAAGFYLASEYGVGNWAVSYMHGAYQLNPDQSSVGEFNWSSQHLDRGGVQLWRRGTGPRRRAMCPRVRVGNGVRIGRCVRRCVRPGGLSPRGRCSGSSGV